ncbi:MAG: acetyl-CoA carboxylase biotin carboxyl carrier protein [Candidatus Krumholzibacteriota bacterium]|nr:acetyl-CoA carboxylase biotin carboxyl carrier protein [Candidatus Krumholzibacteriota bacterium]
MRENEIRKLAAILREEDLDEIEIRGPFSSIRVARRVAVAAPASGEIVQSASSPAPAEAAAEVPVDETGAVEEAPAASFEEVVSPMVGTFYRASSPGAEPFVAVGQRVEVGEVLCIIEAMKLMNEIEAERSGIIQKVLVENAQPVEFGQPLFLLDSA